MFMSKKSKIVASMLGVVCLMTGVTRAADAAQETFEAVTDWANLSALWGGYASIYSVTETETYAGVRPVAGTSAKALSVEGFVSYDSSSVSVESQTSSTVDMMVKVSLPDEALSFPSDETDAFMIASGIDLVDGSETSGEFKILISNAEDATWISATSPLKFAVGEWIRVTYNFSYSNKKCQVLVNGSPFVSSSGYATADATGDANGGSWYSIAKDATTVSAVKVIGTTTIDDMVVKASAATTLPTVAVTTKGTDGLSDPSVDSNFVVNETTNNIKVDKQYLADNGIAFTAAGSVATKYAAGLQPTSTESLKLQNMQMGTKGKVTLTLPKTVAVPNYKNVIQAKVGNGEWETKTSDASGENTKETVEFDLDTVMDGGKVLKFRLVTVAK